MAHAAAAWFICTHSGGAGSGTWGAEQKSGCSAIRCEFACRRCWHPVICVCLCVFKHCSLMHCVVIPRGIKNQCLCTRGNTLYRLTFFISTLRNFRKFGEVVAMFAIVFTACYCQSDPGPICKHGSTGGVNSNSISVCRPVWRQIVKSVLQFD